MCARLYTDASPRASERSTRARVSVPRPYRRPTTVLERRGFGAARVCISCFSRPTTLAPRVASRRLHHTVEHYITENDEPRVQSPGTLASLMCVMPLPRGECTAPATIPRNSRNRSHFVRCLRFVRRCSSPRSLFPAPLYAYTSVRVHASPGK